MARLPFQDLGFTLPMRAAMSEALHTRREGLLLITSPRRLGRSTTLSALLFDFSPYPEVAAQYSRASIVEDVSDSRAAETVHKRAVRGECVFATMVADSIADAFARLVELGFPSGSLRDCLRGALNQRLARRTCPACQVPIYASTQAASEYLDPASRLDIARAEFDASFVSCRGCWECGGLGHSGNIGLFEWLDPICLTDLENGAAPDDVRRYLCGRQPRMREAIGAGAYISLLDDLRDKLLERTITIEEAQSHLRL